LFGYVFLKGGGTELAQALGNGSYSIFRTLDSTRQAMYVHVTLTCVHATVVVVGKQLSITHYA
jgi:hypothetical protein